MIPLIEQIYPEQPEWQRHCEQLPRLPQLRHRRVVAVLGDIDAFIPRIRLEASLVLGHFW